MPIRTVLILAIMFFVISPTAWSYTATCYPEAAAYNTGSTDGATKTETSLVRADEPENGWLRFDVSAIPDGQTIHTIYFHFYATAVHAPSSTSYCYFTPIDSDPLTSDAATLWADITDEGWNGGAYFNRFYLDDIVVPGWQMVPMDVSALDKLESGLVLDWFGIGIAEHSTDALTMEGWAETNIPYIVVGHTDYAGGPWYVDDDAPGDPGINDPLISDPLEDGSPAHPFDAIQEGIGAASPGDLVLVEDGLYTGPGNTFIQFQGKPATVRSMNGPENCIIDGENTSWGFFTLEGDGPDAVIEGFTIRNCSASYGAGIYCSSYASPTIRGNIIENNWSQYDGGGINCRSGSSARIEGNLITGNTAQREGGGIYFTGADCLVLDNVISGNTGGVRGGIFARSSSAPTLVGNTISGNDGGIGGGIYLVDSSAAMTNNLVTGNVASGGGGGLFCSNSTLTAEFVTIADNTANNGGAIGCANSTVTVTSAILWGDSPSEVNTLAGSAPAITSSNVQGGYSGSGNINADPLFASGIDGDYSLGQVAAGQAVDSPCVDVGFGQAKNNCFTLPDGTRCIDFFSTRTDGVNDREQSDMGFHRPGFWQAVAGMTCWPESGTLPMSSTMLVNIGSGSESQTRRIAGRINLTTGGGMYIAGWRAGFTNISPGEQYSTSWNQQFPALGTLVGVNRFQLNTEDVTPAPYNQPPYPPAGGTGTGSCAVEGMAP